MADRRPLGARRVEVGAWESCVDDGVSWVPVGMIDLSEEWGPTTVSGLVGKACLGSGPSSPLPGDIGRTL